MISIDHDPSADDNEPASAALIPSVQSSPALCAPSPLLANAHTPASSQPQPPPSPPELSPSLTSLQQGSLYTAHTQPPQQNQNHALSKWEGSSPHNSKECFPGLFSDAQFCFRFVLLSKASLQGLKLSLNPRLRLNLLPVFLVEQVGERRLPPMTAPVAS